MLHDIGELVLASLGRAPTQVADHARAGGFLLGLWGIEDRVVDAITYHHEPGAIPDGQAKLVDLLHVSEIVTGELVATAAGRDDAEVISGEWLGRNPPSVLDHARTIARQLWGQPS